MLRVYQAIGPQAVRSELPGVDHEPAVSDLHPARALLVQNRARRLCRQTSAAASNCSRDSGDVSGLHERGAGAAAVPSAFRQCLTGRSALVRHPSRTMASASSKVRRCGGSGNRRRPGRIPSVGVSLGSSRSGIAPTPEPPPAPADRVQGSAVSGRHDQRSHRGVSANLGIQIYDGAAESLEPGRPVVGFDILAVRLTAFIRPKRLKSSPSIRCRSTELLLVLRSVRVFARTSIAAGTSP